MENQLFNLKFTAKQLSRMSKKAEKEEKAEKAKVKKAIEKGNMEGARIYAQNAIRQKNQSMNYLRLSSRVDAVASRVESAVKMQLVTKQMAGVVKGMESSLQSMDVEKARAAGRVRAGPRPAAGHSRADSAYSPSSPLGSPPPSPARRSPA